MRPALPPTTALGWTWRVTLAVSLLSLAVLPALASLGWIAGIVLAVVTLARAPRAGDVVQPRWYRAVLGALAATGAIGVVTAASVLVIDPRTGDTDVALASSALAHLALAITAWRALTRPSPRRAAAAGLIAVGGLLVALIVDVAIHINLRPGAVLAQRGNIVLGYLLLVGGAAGAAACLQAIHGFRRPGGLPVAEVRAAD